VGHPSLPCCGPSLTDRSNVTNARVAGMQEDMNMTDVQWVSIPLASEEAAC